MNWEIEDDFLKNYSNKSDLNLEIIENYNFSKTELKTDSFIQNTYTLPNGLELYTLIESYGEILEPNCLEGLCDFLYIETKAELDELINMSYENIIEKVASENEDFFKDDWL